MTTTKALAYRQLAHSFAFSQQRQKCFGLLPDERNFDLVFAGLTHVIEAASFVQVKDPSDHHSLHSLEETLLFPLPDTYAIKGRELKPPTNPFFPRWQLE